VLQDGYLDFWSGREYHHDRQRDTCYIWEIELFEYVDDAFLDYKPRDLRSLWE
jgi:hypothetical protein